MRFWEAATVARSFTQRFPEEFLPEALVFRVRPNGSYDGSALHEDERVYPEEGSPAVGAAFHDFTCRR
jgi:hypothetical protein